jgi:hypothetical protein
MASTAPFVASGIAAALITGAAVASASGPRPVSPTATAPATQAATTPVPGWNNGPTFKIETACYTYGAKQVWPIWECHHGKNGWTYRYWIEPATERDW